MATREPAGIGIGKKGVAVLETTPSVTAVVPIDQSATMITSDPAAPTAMSTKAVTLFAPLPQKSKPRKNPA
jgi:hypothetical protein